MNLHVNAKIHTTKPLFPCTCGLNDWTVEREKEGGSSRSREKNTPSYSALLSSSLVIDRSSPAFVPGSRVTLSDFPLPFVLHPSVTRTRLVLRVTGFRELLFLSLLLPGSRENQKSSPRDDLYLRAKVETHLIATGFRVENAFGAPSCWRCKYFLSLFIITRGRAEIVWRTNEGNRNARLLIWIK